MKSRLGNVRDITLFIIHSQVFGGQCRGSRTVLEAEWDTKNKTGLFPQTFII